MPQIRIDVDPKGLQRYSDFTHDPGPMESTVGGSAIMSGEVRDGMTVGQDNTLVRLMAEGISLAIDEGGKVTVVEE